MVAPGGAVDFPGHQGSRPVTQYLTWCGVSTPGAHGRPFLWLVSGRISCSNPASKRIDYTNDHRRESIGYVGLLHTATFEVCRSATSRRTGRLVALDSSLYLVDAFGQWGAWMECTAYP